MQSTRKDNKTTAVPGIWMVSLGRG